MTEKIIEKLRREKLSATWMIAGTLKQKTSVVYRKMVKLEKEGRVKRHQFTSKNNVVWELA